MTGSLPDSFVAWSTCDACGKRSYESRKDARRVARRLSPGKGRVHAYRCRTTGLWHVGHVPTPVKTGRVSRRDYGGRRAGSAQENR